MHPEAINACMGRASVVGCEVKPNCVNNARARCVQHFEGLYVCVCGETFILV